MPTKPAQDAIRIIPLDPDHDIDLKAGKFEGTNGAQLTQAFAKFAASGSDHVCVFFHGGLPGIYNKSLLYIVCSLCEEDSEADKPLVGMQRYWSRTRPYDQPYINAVTDFVGSSRKVWSPSRNTAPPGYQTDANRHGDFPIDPKTNGSVCYALKNGV